MSVLGSLDIKDVSLRFSTVSSRTLIRLFRWKSLQEQASNATIELLILCSVKTVLQSVTRGLPETTHSSIMQSKHGTGTGDARSCGQSCVNNHSKYRTCLLSSAWMILILVLTTLNFAENLHRVFLRNETTVVEVSNFLYNITDHIKLLNITQYEI